MYLMEIAKRMPKESLARLLESPIWREAASEGANWTEAAADEKYIKFAADRLEPAARTALGAMIVRFGRAPVEEERMLIQGASAAGISGAEFRYGLHVLVQAGIVFAVRKAWGERLYFIPTDSFSIWLRQLFPGPFAGYSEDHSDSPHFFSHSGETNPKPLGEQLLAVWAELARTGTGLTAQGRLPKRTADKLVKLLKPIRMALDGVGLPDAIDIPKELAFALELSERIGVLKRGKRKLDWSENGMAAWFAAAASWREAVLLRICREWLLADKQAAAWLDGWLAEAKPGIWQNRGNLKQQLERLDGVFGFRMEPLATGEGESWLDLLSAFGWLELAAAPSGKLLRWLIAYPGDGEETLPRAASDTRAEEPVSVEPNGDIIVLPGCSWRVRWALEQFADKLSDDTVAIYRLNAAASARAVEHEWDAARIASFLETASGGRPLPEVVSENLQHWARQAMYRTGQQERMERTAGSYPNMPDDLPVSGNELHSLLFCEQQLHEPAGWLPALADIRSFELVGPPEQSGIDKLDKLFPELGQTPASWIKQLRPYHHSTRKEMMEKALYWQAPVQLRLNGSLQPFVPLRLSSDVNGWSVEGLLREPDARREVRLTPDMWEEMRLVVPGSVGFMQNCINWFEEYVMIGRRQAIGDEVD
ncbi:hypothetical protein [Paenibacillus sp. NPDC058071]|uniref:hypothetical protein n=1 Tax=Paenibacillus sp. NPDC058071 TaxID=3346326 RepID=UPI0036DD5B76